MGEVRSLNHLDVLIMKLDSIQYVYYQSIPDQSRRDLLDIAMSIAKSSYEYWTPESYGGKDMQSKIGDIRSKFKVKKQDRNENLTKNWASPHYVCACCESWSTMCNCTCTIGGSSGSGGWSGSGGFDGQSGGLGTNGSSGGGALGGGRDGGGFGEWFAITTSVDIIAGISSAGKTAYGAAVVTAATGGLTAPAVGPAVLSAGLFSATISSTVAGIMNSNKLNP